MIAFALALYQEDGGSRSSSVTSETVRRTLREFAQKPEKGRAIAFESDGQLVGYALLVIYWSNELGGDTVFIDELFVHPDYRNQGIAALFFEWLEREVGDYPSGELQSNRAVALMLETTPENARAAALYQRLGFKAYANLPFIKYL